MLILFENFLTENRPVVLPEKDITKITVTLNQEVIIYHDGKHIVSKRFASMREASDYITSRLTTNSEKVLAKSFIK